MASKVITGKQKQAEQIKEAIRTHGGAIADALDAKVPQRPGAGAAVHTLLQIAHDTLDDALLRATQTDAAHAAELADDHRPRTARDEAAERVRSVLVDLRRTVAALHGNGLVKTLGFPGQIPREPAQVERVARDVVAALRQGPLPKPALVGVAPVSSKDWSTLLDEGLAALASARAEVTREAQEARATQTAKDQASAALTEAMVTAAQVTVSLARLAGRPELVAGLRGTLPHGTMRDLDDAVDGGEAPPAQGTGTDASRPLDPAPPAEPPRRGASVPPSPPRHRTPREGRTAARRKR
jgi:hypothetical protein